MPEWMRAFVAPGNFRGMILHRVAKVWERAFLIRAGASTVRAGASLTQEVASLTQEVASLTQEVASLARAGASPVRAGASLTQEGASLSRAGASPKSFFSSLRGRSPKQSSYLSVISGLLRIVRRGMKFMQHIIG
ncbi:MAG: hypothetical protein LBJ47_10155, partial [Tannerella sp.]|nr:hypothetical protein [Tannerella sp.]